MTLEITHLKQLHKIPGIPDYDSNQDICVQVARAQYELASYLTKNTNIPVIRESLYDDIDCINYIDICNITKEIFFPNGLPDSFEKLNHLQRTMLYREGAALTLTYMGVLPKIYKAIEKEDSDRIDEIFNTLPYHVLYNKITTEDDFGNRENFALDKATSVAQDYYGSPSQGKVFIIFGAAHDFKKECAERGFKLTEVCLNSYPFVDTIAMPTHIDSRLISASLNRLMNDHPRILNQLLNSQYVDKQELDEFAQHNFAVLQKVVLSQGLVGFILNGVLSLGQLPEVHFNKNIYVHLWGIIKDSLLSGDISFDQILAMPIDTLPRMRDFKNTVDLAEYVHDIVGDMDQSMCLWIE